MTLNDLRWGQMWKWTLPLRYTPENTQKQVSYGIYTVFTHIDLVVTIVACT